MLRPTTLAIALLTLATPLAAADRPNILFIMSDDHTTQAIGAYGSRLAQLDPTPTIDRLAREGIVFENAYCTNSTCTPSRACILTGQLDNMVIIYTGDQGFMLGEHDYMDKRWMYEQSQRMPFIVRYPKTIQAGSRSKSIVENVDYGPTMLAFAGVETPRVMQGRSFRTICEAGQEPEGWKQEAYYRYWMHMAQHDTPGHLGIRTKEYKLLYFYGCNYRGQLRTPPGWELYDLQNDPSEVVNQYDNPEYAKVVIDLKDRLAKLRQRVGDTGEDYPAVEAVIDEFWDYDDADRTKAIEISHQYLQSRQTGGKN